MLFCIFSLVISSVTTFQSHQASCSLNVAFISTFGALISLLPLIWQMKQEKLQKNPHTHYHWLYWIYMVLQWLFNVLFRRFGLIFHSIRFFSAPLSRPSLSTSFVFLSLAVPFFSFLTLCPLSLVPSTLEILLSSSHSVVLEIFVISLCLRFASVYLALFLFAMHCFALNYINSKIYDKRAYFYCFCWWVFSSWTIEI